ncbi:uncharacterized protein K489DRAFT_378906 [Dissoconium aciculare CBS 342.82]|uniref:LCCL domain-containing protein n=1 Tax=Dissoconium aciculare CBS 342.82 TaxID=1314786 RepID=A0A6J3MCD0_9PEZI|nr:uncharacterized protein K489DRAFT_378906 [Dissoconium aciculare CBS 342.82]KAF1824487.1 hypothetical protein K489DRAFT_378906 [Dissoconium aciculare CBS 342.82]
MAAPTTVNIKNLTGTFVMDKTLSDSSIPVLKMQKIPWIVQQAVYYSTITVKLKQTTDEAGVVHIDQEQLSTGTVQHEPRLVTGEWAERDVQFWGKVKGKTSYKKISELTDDFLKEGWAAEHTAEGDDAVILESYTESLADTWTATQIWGFAEVQGERRHVRRILAEKEGKTERIRLVYNYQGE